MARLNITIPDALYERLEALRDRINLSKVCANALEKEVIMLEGQARFNDPRIEKLLQRLQGTRERWYRRGHQDGIDWAVEKATREELEIIAGTQTLPSHTNNMLFYHPPMPPMPPLQPGHGMPAMFPPPPPPLPRKESPYPSPSITSFSVSERLKYWQEQESEEKADESAYLEGWQKAIKEIWESISPAL